MREAVETMPSDWSKHAGESRDQTNVTLVVTC